PPTLKRLEEMISAARLAGQPYHIVHFGEWHAFAEGGMLSRPGQRPASWPGPPGPRKHGTQPLSQPLLHTEGGMLSRPGQRPASWPGHLGRESMARSVPLQSG